MQRNGFTLVELMVAISVMALLTSIVTLATGAGDHQPQEAAARFASRLAAARDHAVLSGQPISIWVSSSGYGFDRYAQGRWLPFAERPFEGEDWASGVKPSNPEGRQRIRFDSLGLPDRSLELTLASDERTASVRVLANGEVAVR